MSEVSTEGVWPYCDLAHLAHLELLTPKLEQSLHFFTEVMGLSVSESTPNSVYLRGWDDYEHHTLKLTAAPQPGLGHFAFRVRSPEALARRVRVLEQSGLGQGWVEERGHGPAYRFHTPDGHLVELYYETTWYTPTEATRPALKNQASRFPGKGANLRRLDHINLLAADVRAMRLFMEGNLGMKVTEQIIFSGGDEQGVWLTSNNKTYDVAITKDHLGARGRFHHCTYAVDSREEVLRAADICLEHGVKIETGPHKHAIQQTFFLYVYEPGGNRFEVACPGARLLLAPDWKPIVWNEEERKRGQAWGLQTVPTFHTYGTPPVEAQEA
ncbi:MULTISPECIES: catechol 2,3-dioxygenase [unclassified Meiothermus]|uniref:catechol 2,3-dioxygenase n=1 Tax=unclassified Meiothermus TaxID=370471 RepID=UPI000D7C44BA|nr:MULTISPECIES: catechol 2,3-dioxygenase [unclassified Meiothermus]PZA07668.1 catechol 2,3-dioxygenase [Meiothermus sp. Pnk-1]RYM36505.1 catechol 2,3-dioxygenase [Meiothermus sp. PNK-Is4]